MNSVTLVLKQVMNLLVIFLLPQGRCRIDKNFWEDHVFHSNTSINRKKIAKRGLKRTRNGTWGVCRRAPLPFPPTSIRLPYMKKHPTYLLFTFEQIWHERRHARNLGRNHLCFTLCWLGRSRLVAVRDGSSGDT